MSLKQTAMALRFWADTIHHGIEHALDPTDESPHARERRAAVQPTADGAGIVIAISLLERLAMDKLAKVRAAPPKRLQGITSLQWVTELGLSLVPGTRAELENFVRLRHCFAHEYGRATSSNIGALRQHLANLRAGSILDEKGNAVAPYFEIDEDDQLSLTNEARNRLRLTMWAVMKEIDSK